MAESSARSSRWSSSSGQGGGGYDGQGSPIPYRTGPLDYAGEVQCACKIKACRWVSWSDDNSGRRYHRCRWSKVKSKDCGFFEWYDPECPIWYKDVLRELRDTVWKLKKERSSDVADVVVDSANGHGQEAEKMNLLLQKELLKKSAEVDDKDKDKDKELKDKDNELLVKDKLLKEIEAKMKNNNWWLQVVVCLCVGLVIMVLILSGNVP